MTIAIIECKSKINSYARAAKSTFFLTVHSESLITYISIHLFEYIQNMYCLPTHTELESVWVGTCLEKHCMNLLGYSRHGSI